MTSPTRSVVVRLAMDPSSYITGASRAEASTLSLDRAVSKVGPSAATNMERAAAGAASAESSFGKLNKVAGTLGVTMGGLAGVGAAVGAALSVKWAGDYESALTRLVTTAGESQKNIKMVGQGLLDMAGQVGVAADELAKGAYTVESGGFHGADALTVMKAAAEGAKQENADLGKVTDAVTTILHDYHLAAGDAATVTSQLVTAVSHGKTTFDELTGSLHSVTPLASKMGISLADITGTLAAMTASGESADQATDNMANTLQHLAAPTQTMISELAQLGISTDDLANSLSTNGLAGTLQMVEEAIVNHLDPATQRVLLPALNQSKTAAHDLQIMLGQMPPTLAQLAKGLMDGSVSFSDFRKDVRDLGGQAEVMGTQFLGLYQSSQGFNNVLKAGGPDAQVFTAAMQKAFGTTAALNVALQTTGENAAATNAAIKDIAGAASQADGNIKGWDEVQATFNQRLAEAEAGIKSLAIEAGQHLLPALSSALGWVASDGVPALEHLGSAVGGAVHWFSELPGPVRDTALALGAIELARMTGLWDALGSGLSRFRDGATGVKTALGGLRDEMALHQALYQAQARDTALAAAGTETLAGRMGALTSAANGETESLTRAQMTLRGYDAALAETVVEQDVASASSGRFAGALGALSAQGMAGLRSAGSGVLNMLGGPWGAALLGATLVVTGMESAIQHAKQTEDQWTEALKEGGIAAERAGQQMAEVKSKVDQMTGGFQGAANSALGLGNLFRSMAPDVDRTRQSYDGWYKSLFGSEKATEDVRQATANLNQALQEHGEDSSQARTASVLLQGALDRQTTWENMVSDATKTAAQRAQEHAQALLTEAQSSLGSKQSFDQFLVTLDAYRNSTDHSALAQDNLAMSALSAASAAGQAGEAWAKSNGIQDTNTASGYAQLVALQKVADAMGSDTPAAVSQQIAALQQSVAQGHLTAQQMDDITRAIDGIPKDPSINVSANTQDAQNTIDGFLRSYQNVQYTGSAIIVNGRVVANAEGNLLPMESTRASIVSPGTLRVIGDNPVADEAFIPINSSARSLSILGETAARMGFGLAAMAGGGIWNIGEQFPAQPSGAMLDSAARTAASFKPPYNASAGVEQWRGVALQALGILGQSAGLIDSLLRRMDQESAGNPYAVNRWDSNWAAGTPSVGLMQVIGPTYAAYHDPAHNAGPFEYGVSEDPMSNILASGRYALGAYGSLSAAYDRTGGYDTGGALYPGTTLAYNGTGKVERVYTAEQNSALQARLGAPPQVAVRVFLGDRELTDIVRVEATAIVDREMGQLANDLHYQGR